MPRHFKRVKVADELRQSAATVNKLSQGCNGCGRWFDKEKVAKVCSGCQIVSYCNEQCQKKHWGKHKILCRAINFLCKQEDEKCRQRCEFESHLDSEQQHELVDLIGKRCIVNCRIGGVKVKSLWDTGSQVSLVSLRWLRKHVGEFDLRSLSDILGGEVCLEGVAGRKIPYKGYINLKFEIGSSELVVPFLVTSERIVQPILGFNLISALAKSGKGFSDFQESFDGISEDNVIALVNFLRAYEPRRLAKVFTYKQGALIRAKSSISIPCKVDCAVTRRTPVLFEPSLDTSLDEDLQVHESLVTLKAGPNPRIFVTVTNSSSSDIKLSGKTWLGDLNMVNSVTPAEVEFQSNGELGKSEKNDGTSDVNNTLPKDSSSVGYGKEKHSDIVSVMNESGRGGNDEKKMVEGNLGVSLAEVFVTEGEAESGEFEDKFLKSLDKLNLENLTDQEKVSARAMLLEERDSFAKDENDIGNAPDLQMDIHTTDEVPVQKSYNTIQKPLYAEVKNHLQNLLNRGWITRSKSSWSSPVVVVRKKSGDMRLCIDYRALNKKTIPDKHPIPKIQDSLDSLGNSSWFTTLDQSKAYYQGFISEESRKKCAFVTPWGLFQWTRIPFGLRNAPSTFQRFMEEALVDFRDDCCIPYLDDVILFSGSFEDHLLHLRKVLQRLRSKGIKLKLEKCNFFQKEVKFLGRIVSREGYRMDEASVDSVRELKNMVPSNVGQVRQLLGLVGYHWRHIQDFASIAKPLTDLLLDDGYKKNAKIKNPAKGNKGVPSSKPIEWNDEHQKSLNQLVDMVTSAPILAYPDYTQRFFVHTDASGIGLGAILYQEKDGLVRVLGYGSRTLKPAEKKYHSTKLETLALKWAITEKFKDYLAYCDHFEVYTDYNPLCYLMENCKLNATSQRWVSELSNYNFTVKYRPGIINRDADCLSRLPLDFQRYKDLCSEVVQQNAFEAIVAGIKVQSKNLESWIPDAIVSSLAAGDVKPKDLVSLQSLRDAQHSDPSIFPVFNQLGKPKKKGDTVDLGEAKLLWREAKRLFVDKNGILCRRSGHLKQIILPQCFKKLIYQHLHQQMGHLGAERTFQLARKRVYWPRMFSEIEDFVRRKCRCVVQKKTRVQHAAPLQSIHTSSPMELVAIDFLHLDKSSSGHEYVLLIVDGFSKYAQAYPTRNKSALTAAKHLYGDFVLRYGLPGRILHDQGGNLRTGCLKSCIDWLV